MTDIHNESDAAMASVECNDMASPDEVVWLTNDSV